MKHNRGFTLIEVLIVVGIIGLLASVVLSGLGSVRSRGRDARRVADLRQVQQSLELYYTKNQFYPDQTTWENLGLELEGADLGVSGISNDPLCADSGTSCRGHMNYSYFSIDADSYVLQAKLEDEKSPLLKDSFKQSYGGSACGPTSGNYCVKF